MVRKVNNERSGGRPSAAKSAGRPLAALREMQKRYEGLDELLAQWLAADIHQIEFMAGLDALFANAVDEPYDNFDSPLAGEEAVRLARLLHRLSIARGALSAHEARLIDAEASVSNALIGADIERRLMPAYLAEFASLLQLNGIARNHLRDLSKAKLARVIEVLTGEEREVRLESPAIVDAKEAETTAGLWDSIDLGELPYEIEEQESFIAKDIEPTPIRLPPVPAIGELAPWAGQHKIMVDNVEAVGDLYLALELLESWSSQERIDLTAEERKVWTFLLVAIPFHQRKYYKDDERMFDGIVFPGRVGSMSVRKVRALPPGP